MAFQEGANISGACRPVYLFLFRYGTNYEQFFSAWFGDTVWEKRQKNL